MKFPIEKVNCMTAGLTSWSVLDGKRIVNGDVDALEMILKAYSVICGEKTKQRLVNAIVGCGVKDYVPEDEAYAFGVNYSDTPIRGRHYVYLWFDATGELFYIGKGQYDRVSNIRQRSDTFRARADGGYYRVLAYRMDEIYALDLERVLIWEALLSGKDLLNADCGYGADAIRYCKRDRDALLWYWDREGTIGRFSELTGIEVIYDARNDDLVDVIDERSVWHSWGSKRSRTNDPRVQEESRLAEEKKRKERDRRAQYRAKKQEGA